VSGDLHVKEKKETNHHKSEGYRGTTERNALSRSDSGFRGVGGLVYFVHIS